MHSPLSNTSAQRTQSLLCRPALVCTATFAFVLSAKNPLTQPCVRTRSRHQVEAHVARIWPTHMTTWPCFTSVVSMLGLHKQLRRKQFHHPYGLLSNTISRSILLNMAPSASRPHRPVTTQQSYRLRELVTRTIQQVNLNTLKCRRPAFSILSSRLMPLTNGHLPTLDQRQCKGRPLCPPRTTTEPNATLADLQIITFY